MQLFDALSIKSKVASVVFFGVAAFMIIALANFIYYDRFTIKRAIQEELNVLASITAARSGAALAFFDTNTASENLQQLSIRENILLACIYTDKTALFAKYERNNKLKLKCPVSSLGFEHVTNNKIIMVTREIKNKSKVLGKIVVVSDLSPLTKKISTWLGLSVLMVVFSVIVVFLMMHRMQRFVIEPLGNLASVMGKVKKNNDLSVRAKPGAQDEIGRLIDSFNEMLGLIENGNSDLEIVYSELITRSTEAETVAIELEARNKEIKEFLSGAAHDLRQPLQAMAIFVDMLELIASDDRLDDLISKLKASMDNLQSMFSEILDTSKLEHKRGTADYEDVSLEVLFSKLHHEFSALADNKNIQLRVFVSDIQLHTVPGILERLVRNLVSNAIRYTDKGGVLISARNREQEIWVEVWDTGRGISESNLDRIFKKFEQAEGVNTERGSYGLGLAIVQNFINLLGYRLDVKSVIDTGSLFRIVIPHQETMVETTDLTCTTSSHYKEQSLDQYKDVMAQMLKINVILVDDDEQVRLALKMAMASWDINVIDFDGLGSVVEYFSSGDFIDPDLIVSDYQLSPTVTGDKVIKEIRLMSGVDVPAFVVTGNRDKATLKNLELNNLEYLHKPIDMRAFKATLFRYFDDAE